MVRQGNRRFRPPLNSQAGGADVEEKRSLWMRQNPESEMRNEHSTEGQCENLVVERSLTK